MSTYSFSTNLNRHISFAAESTIICTMVHLVQRQTYGIFSFFCEQVRIKHLSVVVYNFRRNSCATLL